MSWFGCGSGPAAPPPNGVTGPSSTGGGDSVSSGGTQGNVLTFGGGGSGATAGAGAGGGGNAAVCGNSLLEPGEGCDDGNGKPGDGCDGNCLVQPGWECLEPGQPCQQKLVCGDGLSGPGQACDDGNTQAGDGCSATCQVEDGFGCTGWGPGSCTPTTTPPVCPNSKVEAGESCDDGNSSSGDGCSATCQLEPGYICPQPGAPCERDVYCGDGLLNQAGEACDDGNLKPGDCCSATCTLEPNCECETPSPPLDPPHQLCHSTVVCGDGKLGPGEACDDQNQVSGDGCSRDCTNVEPGYTCPTPGAPCVPAIDPCGNGQADTGEECDDHNTASNDGCSANCRVEPGYVCPTVGQPCQPILFCGDGIISYPRGENCDDGGTQSGDGCSSTCHIEPNWICNGTPSVCTYDVKCGDKRITGSETCDDGNTTSNDGCSATCQLESGYTCPIVGAKCKPLCGDGRILAPEQCDDGGTAAGDGCSPTCQTETGWSCTGTPSKCKAAVCGNSVIEAGEGCDDGNTRPFDGCSPTCQNEPRCGTSTSATGACRSVCGDGILLRGAGEQCDDGNVTSGDGCSSTCQQEPGYSCLSAYDSPPPTLNLPIVVRDFSEYINSSPPTGHPDFNRYCCNEQKGIVQSLLDVNRKPVYAGTDAAPVPNTTSKTAFDQWYRDVPGVNITFYQTLTLLQNATATTTYAMNSDTDQPWYPLCGFFPLDDLTNPVIDQNTKLPLTYTDEGAFPGRTCHAYQGLPGSFGRTGGWANHDYGFTSELRYWFEYRGGESLKFTGDDDVWVFVNGTLAVDLGGVHNRAAATVTLNAANGTGQVAYGEPPGAATTVNFGLAIGSVYEVVVFQAERWCCGSNYMLTLANFLAGKGVCTPKCGDGILTGNEACDLGPGLNTGAYGGCTPDCQLAPFCGDGIPQAQYGEQCDDGSNATPYGNQSGCARGCVLAPYCGDGKVDTAYGEVCDQGAQNRANAYGTGSCTTNCQPGAFCGDGLKNGSEQCDDGPNNGALTSKCNGTCQMKCGDGTVDPGEQCDFGPGANVGGYNGCNSNCTFGPYCGDGIKNGTEECDDGKNDGSYGTCLKNCMLAPFCGDRVVQSEYGEACDLGPGNSSSAYGVGQCTARCRPAPFCGDSAVDTTHGEVCDDGARNSDGTPGACKTDCSGYNPPPPKCGSGAVDPGEQCDDGPANGTASSPCDQRCRFKCGNGRVEDSEECDDGINDGRYGTCAAGCVLGPYCGDGKVNGPEQCDLGSGNQADPYGSTTCTLQCMQGPYCGDGRVQAAHEQCDGQAGCDSTCVWINPT